MKRKLLVFTLILCSFQFGSHAQDKLKAKFGNVSPEDFAPTAYAIDSSASAIVIADVGSTEIVGNSKGGFSLIFKNYRRARVMNKNGYDIADVQIELYTSGDNEEELQNLKAVTYNLENGKVVETKLDIKGSVFKDKINKSLVIKKFTFPNLKDGSIIEYEYKIQSDFIFNLQPWTFQSDYPHLWSEYRVGMPEFYRYVILTQGSQTYAINDRKSRNENFRLSETRTADQTEHASFSSVVTDYRWVMTNVPPLKEENYTSTIRNHISKIEFQLASIGPPFVYHAVMSTWPGVTKSLLEDENFGNQLSKDNGWLNDAINAATPKTAAPMEKAKNIFAWVRDNFTCTNHSRRSIDQPLKNILKSKNGNVAEINLLLTAMLRKADLSADPVLIGTRSHGFTHAVYPLMDRFNYVIARVAIDGQYYFLDASEPRMGFNKLDYQCYNGHARVVNSDATPIEMEADSLKESSITTIFIINENGRSIGSFQQVPGYYESHNIREKYKESGISAVMKDYKKAFGSEITVSKEQVDSLNIYEEPVGVFFDFDLNTDKQDILYVNPMFGEGHKENPFKSAKRNYPVEMPFTVDEVYNLQMEIPEGYVIDEIPKSTVVKFNEEGDASFEYRVSVSGSSILLRSRVQIKHTFFLPDEYESLREFFNLIVKKHNEQIVFKKKK
jgi:hypothetical protein